MFRIIRHVLPPSFSKQISTVPRYKSSFLQKNSQDQFGLLGRGLAPQIEKIREERLNDEFQTKERIVKKLKNNTLKNLATEHRRKLPVITLPATLTKKRRQKIERREEEIRLYNHKYGIDPKNASVVIECKRSEYNHLEGQRYPSTSDLLLVSEHWSKAKYNGDWFVIKRTQKIPSAVADSENRDWESFVHIIDYSIIQNSKERLRFFKPTNIQSAFFENYSLPMHLFLAAETGSGKTVAFAAPILSEIMAKKEKGEQSKAIVLVPTSFLRSQMVKMLRDIVDNVKDRPKIFEGSKESKVSSLNEFDILVATPSRAVSLLKSLSSPLDPNQISTIVIDEADMLLDDSFVDPMSELMALIPIRNSSIKPKSTAGVRVIFSSATCPDELQDLVDGIVDSQSLTYIRSDKLHRLLPNIEQKFIKVIRSERMRLLKELVEKEVQTTQGKMLVFCKDSKRVSYVTEHLKAAGVDCFAIAKGRNYGKIPDTAKILVGTDAASRGLDMPLTHVVNYDFPRHMVDYVHRIGRVGRCNSSKRKGLVTSFVVSDLQISMVKEIEKCARLNRPLQTIETDVAGMIKLRRERIKEDSNGDAYKD